jgi:hypothetical protein
MVPAAGAETAARCQAQPSAARPGYREDMLCASVANCVIRFEAVDVPVCTMHEATFSRWGASPTENARAGWGWGAWPLEVAAALAVAAQLILYSA